MINAWIVVRSQKDIGNRHWVCLKKEDARRDVADYWISQYEVNDEDLWTELYCEHIFMCCEEGLFTVKVSLKRLEKRVKPKCCMPNHWRTGTMAKSVVLTRDEAELVVDVLEDNYRTGKYEQAGIGADLAAQVREIFGMSEQPPMEYKQDYPQDPAPTEEPADG